MAQHPKMIMLFRSNDHGAPRFRNSSEGLFPYLQG